MKLKSFFVLTLFLLMLVTPPTSTVFAKPPNRSSFFYFQKYQGWGPALYYGEDVKIHYISLNTWVLNKWPNDDGTWTIRQELTQKGRAYVYNTDDNLIDVKNFRVVEVTHGIVNYEASWYHVYSLQEVEEWRYDWIIPGVYHYACSYTPQKEWQFDYWIKGIGWIHLYP